MKKFHLKILNFFNKISFRLINMTINNQIIHLNNICPTIHWISCYNLSQHQHKPSPTEIELTTKGISNKWKNSTRKFRDEIEYDKAKYNFSTIVNSTFCHCDSAREQAREQNKSKFNEKARMTAASVNFNWKFLTRNFD